MKKILIILLPALIFALSGCDTKTTDEPNVPTPEELTASIYDVLATDLDENTDYGDMAERITGWADDNGIQYNLDNNNIIVISSAATKGHEKDESVVFECALEESVTDEDCQKLAFMLYNACMLEEHGSITALITEKDNENSIPESYLNSDNFINIEYGKKIQFVNKSSASATYRLRHGISRIKPKYDIALKIGIEGLPDSVITDIGHESPNPTKRISNLLATWKSSGNLYEIGDFKAGVSTGRYPSYAEMVVVLSENDEEKFMKRVTKMQSKLESQISDDLPDYRFTAVRTAMPETVLEDSCASDLISLLYTLDSGIYESPEEEDVNAGYTNLATVRLKSKNAVVKVRNFSMDENILEDMNDSVTSLAEISSFKSKKISSTDMWTASEDEGILKDLQDASPKAIEISDKEGINICQKIKEINPDTDCITLKINSDDWSKGLNMFSNYYEKDAD